MPSHGDLPMTRQVPESHPCTRVVPKEKTLATSALSEFGVGVKSLDCERPTTVSHVLSPNFKA